MRRSSVALAVGIFLTMVLLYLWGLSAKGIGHACFRPQGRPPGGGKLHAVYTVGIRAGSLVFCKNYPALLPSGGDYFRVDFVTFAKMQSGSLRFVRPPWSEIVGGRLSWNTDRVGMSTLVYLPMSMVVFPLVYGTVVVVRILRKRERKMIEEGRLG